MVKIRPQPKIPLSNTSLFHSFINIKAEVTANHATAIMIIGIMKFHLIYFLFSIFSKEESLSWLNLDIWMSTF